MNLEKIYNLYYPNFQAEYNGTHAKIAIDRTLIEGKLPAEVMVELMDWAKIHYYELDESWMRLIAQTKNRPGSTNQN